MSLIASYRRGWEVWRGVNDEEGLVWSERYEDSVGNDELI
jgi:hypothetical protein